MKTGIIVYSMTGNTLSVAEMLADKLTQKGQDVVLERITTVGDNPSKSKNYQLQQSPDVSGYDVLVFATPVWAFHISTVMHRYLSQLSSLSGKKVACFVTHSFSVSALGGNGSANQMAKICSEKGATVYATGVVSWNSKKREEQINLLIEKLSDY